MQCHVIVLDATGTTYTMYEREKNRTNRNKSKVNKLKNKETNKTESHAPQKVMWPTIQK